MARRRLFQIQSRQGREIRDEGLGAPGYLNVKQEFESDIAEEDADYAVDFILAAINKPQVVENIFYDFDKATLRPESKAASTRWRKFFVRIPT